MQRKALTAKESTDTPNKVLKKQRVGLTSPSDEAAGGGKPPVQKVAQEVSPRDLFNNKVGTPLKNQRVL